MANAMPTISKKAPLRGKGANSELRENAFICKEEAVLLQSIFISQRAENYVSR